MKIKKPSLSSTFGIPDDQIVKSWTDLVTNVLKERNISPMAKPMKVSDNTSTTGYRQMAEGKLFKINQQMDLDKLDDITFGEKYGTSKHKVLYESNPVYKEKVDKNAVEVRKTFGSIDLPSTDIRSKNYEGNPNLAFMTPQQTSPELKKNVEGFNMGLISSVLPIPGLMQTGEVKGLLNMITDSKSFVPQMLKPIPRYEIPEIPSFINGRSFYLPSSKPENIQKPIHYVQNIRSGSYVPSPTPNINQPGQLPLVNADSRYKTYADIYHNSMVSGWNTDRITPYQRKWVREWNSPDIREKFNRIVNEVMTYKPARIAWQQEMRFSNDSHRALNYALDAAEPRMPLARKRVNDVLWEVNSATNKRVPTNYLRSPQRPQETQAPVLSKEESTLLRQQEKEAQVRYREQVRQQQKQNARIVEEQARLRESEKKELEELTGKEASDIIIKDVEHQKTFTGGYSYSGENKEIHNIHDVSILPKTMEELDTKIKYFRKAYEQLPKKNTLRSRIEKGLSDLEATKYLRTTFLDELKLRGKNPEFTEMSIVTSPDGNLHNLVNKDGKLLGNISSSRYNTAQTIDGVTTHSLVNDVGSSAVPPVFHGTTTIGKENKIGEALYRGTSWGLKQTSGTGITTGRSFTSTTHLEQGVPVSRLRAQDFWNKGLRDGWAIQRSDNRYEIIRSIVPGGVIAKSILETLFNEEEQ